MAVKEVIISGFGPFIYDDVDEDTGEPVDAISTNGTTSLPNIKLLEILERDIDIELLQSDFDVAKSILTLDFQ